MTALLSKWDFLDSSRVGIWGWSGGGSSTLQALFRFPEIYQAGATKYAAAAAAVRRSARTVRHCCINDATMMFSA